MDKQRARAFAGQMAGVLNAGALGIMVAIGHELQLFETMSGMAPPTSVEIAAAANLDERYVREWLGAMTTGKVVEYDPVRKAYHLPEEHAASLTRVAGPRNIATIATYLPLMGRIAPLVQECFVRGGGVPYSEYEKFQDIMRSVSSQRFDALLIERVLPVVPGLVERLKSGCDVADVGCGAGHALNLMARAFRESRFVGYDVSEEGIALAVEEAASLGLANVTFEARDAAELGLAERFDFITLFDAVHDQAQPAQVLEGVHRALRPGGYVLCADVAASSHLEENLEHPTGTFLYSISTLHCMTVSLAYGGAGLGAVWGKQLAVKMFGEAGFRDISVHHVEGDATNNYYVMRK